MDRKTLQQKSRRTQWIALAMLAMAAPAPSMAYAESAPAQVKSQATSLIKGEVTDLNGEPLIGATVQIKGTNIGAATDLDGKFSLNGPASGTLTVSYIGYESQDVKYSSGQSLLIKLTDSQTALDELVVVGYGVQKKETLTGSVTQVKGDKVLAGKASQSVAASLQGTIPGLTITRTSSRPGNEGTSITLRGGISVNNDANSPMILIDGVEAYQWELSQINPADVENISVLKDAAAAIYGTKAAGGVILVTTKRGKEGKVKVTYSGAVHANFIGERYPVANGREHAQMYLQAADNDYKYGADHTHNWFLGWDETIWGKLAAGERIVGMVNNSWKVLDPYCDQFDETYGTTWGNSHTVMINGGSEKVKVMTSLGYADDRSLVKVAYDGQKKYNFRTNVDYQINDIFKTSFNVSYDKRNTSSPQQGMGHGIQDMYIFPIYNEYGQFYDTFGNNNLIAKMVEGGRNNNWEEITRLGGRLDINLDKYVKGLSFNASANFRMRHHKKIERQTHVTMYDWAGETASYDGYPDYSLGTGIIKSQSADKDCWVKNTLEDTFYQNYSAFANYTRDFGVHHVGLMWGITGEKTRYEKYYQFRRGMTNDELDDINLGDVTSAEATGGRNEVGMISWLGRANYAYNDTFLLEGLFRRDGTSKFSEKRRWANFWGISGGIRFSQFKFVQDWNAFDELKLRGSYGETGSQAGIGNYDYYSTISKGTAIFGYDGSKVNTAWINGMTSDNRTWERVKTTDIGLDFALLNNRLSGTFDWYHRVNDGMLISVTYPQTLGASAPKMNAGGYRSNGWELSLNWQDRIDQVAYNVGFSLADARTKVTNYEGASSITWGNNKIVEGKPINSIYVFKSEGYLQSEEEVAAYYQSIGGAGTLAPAQNTNNQLRPGCVKKVDLNNDGAITVDDVYYYGDSNPHYNFGINLGASWNGFDFSCFIQGVGKQNLVREGVLRGPFAATWTNQPVVYLTETWREDNRDARFPLLSWTGAVNNWNYSQYSDINVMHVWYARMKNAQIGYTFPSSWMTRVGIDKLRLYVSGDNLFELKSVADKFDPENMAGTGQGNVDCYSRTLTFGLDITF